MGELEWRSVGLFLVADIVGVGVLSLGNVFSQLGWALSLIFLTAFCPLNIYMGLLLSRCKQIHPNVKSYNDLSLVTLKGNYFVRFLFLSYVTMLLGAFFSAMRECVQMILYEVSLCESTWSIVVCVLLITPVQITTLTKAKVLVWANCAALGVSIGIALLYIISEEEYVSSNVWNQDMTLVQFCSSVAKITFSYFGCYLFLEMMSEMRDPGDFPKSFVIATPLQYVLYVSVGVVGYSHSGLHSRDMLLKEISPLVQPIRFRIAAASLLLHLIVAYLIKSIVLTRTIYNMVRRDSTYTPIGVNAKEDEAGHSTSRCLWFVISSSLVFSSFILSTMVPLFSNFLDVLGALQVPLLGYIMPITFYVLSKNGNGQNISTGEKLALAAVGLLAIALFFTGTIENVSRFIERVQQQGVLWKQCNSHSILSEYTP